MNQQVRFPYKMERSSFAMHPVTVKAPWRYMPYVLDNLRSETYDIQKAIVTSKYSTLYLKEADDSPLTISRIQNVADIFNKGIIIDERERAKYVYQNQIVLPTDTSVLIYNIPNMNYTVLEFICEDRLGLLCDMLDLLTSLPIDVHSSYVTSISLMAHNIFHIQKEERALTNEEIAYITNIFEYEVKRKDIMGDSSE
jgi:UTP:GlnB (protein PII) uridylyltransferase